MSRLEDHYGTVRDRFGYGAVDALDGLGPLATDRLAHRFVAVDGRETLESAHDRSTIVCTGVGMTGPPHLGTVGQILTAVELQRAGLDVQFVLADLEPYHDGADLQRVTSLAERYRSFLLDVGFDPDRGALRTQAEARDVMHTAEILAPYYAPDEWDGLAEFEPTAWEAAVRDAYEDAEGTADETGERSGPTSDAADAHSAVLHGVDFLHPFAEWGYDQAILAFGLDEHHLTPWARNFRDVAPVDGRIAGLYTRLLPGFGDAPKMSKSIPGSGVSLDMAPETIRDRIRRSDADGGGASPVNSTAFQCMCLASTFDAAALDRLADACETGGAGWQAAKREYAEYVVDLAERW